MGAGRSNDGGFPVFVNVLKFLENLLAISAFFIYTYFRLLKSLTLSVAKLLYHPFLVLDGLLITEFPISATR